MHLYFPLTRSVAFLSRGGSFGHGYRERATGWLVSIFDVAWGDESIISNDSAIIWVFSFLETHDPNVVFLHVSADFSEIRTTCVACSNLELSRVGVHERCAIPLVCDWGRVRGDMYCTVMCRVNLSFLRQIKIVLFNSWALKNMTRISCVKGLCIVRTGALYAFSGTLLFPQISDEFHFEESLDNSLRVPDTTFLVIGRVPLQVGDMGFGSQLLKVPKIVVDGDQIGFHSDIVAWFSRRGKTLCQIVARIILFVKVRG